MKYALIFWSAGGTAHRKLLQETESEREREMREEGGEGCGEQVGKEGMEGAELVVCEEKEREEEDERGGNGGWEGGQIIMRGGEMEEGKRGEDRKEREYILFFCNFILSRSF